jgi:hypothetical protein
MRKSQAVPLTLLAAAAFTISTGCDHPVQVRNCVDAQAHIVPDNSCDRSGGGGGGYHYIYGGASGGRNGDTVEGGSLEPASGARVVSGDTGAVVRGGFGGGEGGEGSEGGHGGGEGGHGGGE